MRRDASRRTSGGRVVVLDRLELEVSLPSADLESFNVASRWPAVSGSVSEPFKLFTPGSYSARAQVRAAELTTRVLQPLEVVLKSDLEFALDLFGADRWPSDLSSDDLLAIDPRVVKVAVEFPIWSVEETNIDWMPVKPVSEGLPDFDGGAPRFALDRYYTTRS